MLKQLLLGAVMMSVTVAIHATFMAAGVAMLRRWVRARPRYGTGEATAVVSTFVLVMFGAVIVEIWAWSGLFIFAGAFDALEPAVYFSTVTYTTLGYGDITLEAPLRMLAAISAVNGVIMFGWTTALLFAVVQRVFFPKNDAGLLSSGP